MQSKRFSGTSVRAVLTEVREVLGRDALILEQHTSGSSVEMLATVAPANEASSTQRTGDASCEHHRVPAESLYVRRLRELRFSETLLARLPAELPDWQTAMRALVRQIPVPQRLPASGLVTFYGAPGAGVSSSLIRYAVHLLRSGKDPKRIRFILSGEARLGGDEKLQLAGHSLGIEVRRTALAQVASELADAHPETLVLADVSAAPSAQIPLSVLQDPLVPQQTMLVIPAHWHPVAVNEWLAAVSEQIEALQRLGCVVTNVDRGPLWGEWLSLIAERQWPLAMVSHGAKLPDDMTVPQGSWLSEKLFDQIDRSGTASKVNAGVRTVDQ